MSRQRMWELPEEDVLGLSFLDTLSCGIGAAVILFLVFSVVKTEAPTPLVSRGNFVRIEFAHREADVLIGLEADVPGATESVVLWATDFDAFGRPVPEAQTRLRSLGAEVILLGASLSGEDGQVAANGERIISLWIREPVEGEWSIGARFVGRSRPGWLTRPGGGVSLRGRLQTRWYEKELEPRDLTPGHIYREEFEVGAGPPTG